MLEQQHPDLEFKRLLLCSRMHLSPSAVSQLQALTRHKPDFELLFDLAVRHKVEQLLYKTLRSQIAGPFPAEQLEPLKERCEEISSRNVALARHLLNIVAELDSQGIASIPYKGPVLTQQIYGDLSMRRYFDLDLLVHPKQYSLAKAFFESQGYTLTAESAAEWECTYAKRDVTPPVLVDLHQAIMPPRFWVDFDFQRLQGRLTTVDLLGRDVSTLSPEDLLLVLCAHASKPADRWKKLRYICDVAELLRRYGDDMNWDDVLSTARELDTYRMTMLGVHLAESLLDVGLPRAVCRQGDASWLSPLQHHIIEVQLKRTTLNERSETYANPEFYLRLRNQVTKGLPTFLFLSKRALRRASVVRLRDLDDIQFPKVLYPLYIPAFALQTVLGRAKSSGRGDQSGAD